MDLFCKVVFFNMLSMLVIIFPPRSKWLFISWLQSPSAVILEPQKIKSAVVSTVSASICNGVMGPDAMIFVLYMLSFKLTFSLSSFTFIKRLFSSSSLSAIRVVSSTYLRLFIFLPVILFQACGSTSPAFCVIHTAYKWNKQANSFLIWNLTIVPCPVLTVVSGPAPRFHRRQVRSPNIPNSWRIFHRLLWTTQSKLWHSQ